jgi:hypothetical protein
MKDDKTNIKKNIGRGLKLRILKTFSSLDYMKGQKEKLLNEITTLHYEKEMLKLENLEMEKNKKKLEASLSILDLEISNINIKNRINEKINVKNNNHKHKINKKTVLIQVLVLIVIIFSVFYHDEFFKSYREERININESSSDTSMYVKDVF